MSVFQITLKMGFERWGWTYSYTTTQASEDPNDYNITSSLLLAIMAAHHDGCTFHAYEVRNLDKPRLAIPKNVRAGCSAGATPAVPNVSVKILIRGGNGANRFLQLRGLPLSWTQVSANGGYPVLPGVATSAINAVIQGMVDSGMQIRQVDTTETNPESTITQVKASTTPANFTEISTGTDLGIVAGDRIRISRLNECVVAGLNGDWDVMAEGAGTNFILPKSWLLPDTTVITPTVGVVRKLSYTQRAVTGWNIHSTGSRDTGRPTTLSRGRSRGERCRL